MSDEGKEQAAISDLLKKAKTHVERGDRQSAAAAIDSALNVVDGNKVMTEKRVLNG